MSDPCCVAIAKILCAPIIAACGPACANQIWPRICSCLPNIFEPSRGSNKKVLALGAGEIKITDADKDECWISVFRNDTRFDLLAELLQVFRLEIQANINFVKLSPETMYAAHLIFKLRPYATGLNTIQEASVYADGFLWRKDVCLTKPIVARTRDNCTSRYPVERSDGWMELELGQFYCNVADDQQVVVSLKETDVKYIKGGLIVAGIEVRPISND